MNKNELLSVINLLKSNYLRINNNNVEYNIF